MVKLLTPLTEPLGLFWALVLLLAAWRLYRHEWRRAIGPLSLAVGLSFLECTKLPAHLLAGLERPYARTDLAQLPRADAVVMLGGVLSISTNDVFGFDLSPAADRAVMAAELVRRGKARALVLGGGGHGPGLTEPYEGQLVARWLSTWKTVSVPVYVLGNCANTRDEGQRTLALARAQGWQHLHLVTSASHMKRAAGVFRTLGLRVTCVACDFQGFSALEEPARFSLVPGLGGLEKLGVYLHEEVGWWLYRWRGWVQE